MSAEPDTKILHLTPDMQFLVLASDGLWEKVRKKRTYSYPQGNFSSKSMLRFQNFLVLVSVPRLLFDGCLC